MRKVETAEGATHCHNHEVGVKERGKGNMVQATLEISGCVESYSCVRAIGDPEPARERGDPRTGNFKIEERKRGRQGTQWIESDGPSTSGK